MAVTGKDVMNWVSTVVVLLAAVKAGMNLGIYNPTLPDIAILTSSTTTQASSTLAAVGLMSMAGAILMGPLFDRYNGHAVLSISLVAEGICLGLAPWCPSLAGFAVCIAAMALFNFGILTGAFATNCRTWQSNQEIIAPIIQLTDMLHVVGTAVTPQVVAPFVGRIHRPPSFNETAWSLNDTQLYLNITTASTTTSIVQPIQVAYLIVAGLDLVMAAVCLVVYVADVLVTNRRRRNQVLRAGRRRSRSLNEEVVRRVASQQALAAYMKVRRAGSVEGISVFGGVKSELVALCPEAAITRQEEDSVPPLGCNVITVVLMTTVFIFFASLGSRETMMGGLLFTYLSNMLGWQTSAGTLLITCYHVTRVVVHAVIVVIARWVSALKLTVFNIVIQIVASAISMLIDTPYVIAGTLLSGVATSNICPTAITLARTSFRVSGRAMGIFIGAVACGQCIISPVVGRVLERPRGDLGFPFILLILSVIAAIFLVPWVVVGKMMRKRMLSVSPDSAVDVKFYASERRGSMKPGLDGTSERRPSVKPLPDRISGRRSSMKPTIDLDGTSDHRLSMKTADSASKRRASMVPAVRDPQSEKTPLLG